MSIFTKLVNFLLPKKKIKPYSLTTTTAYEGEKHLSDIDIGLKHIHNKLKYTQAGSLTGDEINFLLVNELNCNPIQSNLVNLNKAHSDGMVFEFKHININYDFDKDKVEKIDLVYEEITHNSGIKLVVPSYSNDEFLNSFELTINESK